MSPTFLLAEARAIVTRSNSATTGVWPRAATYLTRQALEMALDEYWQRGDMAVATLTECTMETQMACLPEFMEPALARQAAFVWTALSGACHFHPYELGPTAEELDRWLDDVSAFIEAAASAIPT